MGICFFCERTVGSDAQCEVCTYYVCRRCDVAPAVLLKKPHKPEDHLYETELDADDLDAILDDLGI